MPKARLLLCIMGMRQHTIRDTVTFSGIGLHTGCNVSVSILPAEAGTGITFIRKDLPGRPVIKAESANVVATSYATSLGVKGAGISTVEHLLAAFYGLGVDNAVVELDGPEVPVLDGSAALFIDMIESAGFTAQTALKKYLVIRRPIRVSEGDKYIYLQPADDMAFSIDYSIDFSHPFIARQSFSGRFTGDTFKDEVGMARTFGFLSDVETLRRSGLAKGGSLNNAVVVGHDSILNEEGLRFPDEFVRHKVLDMMGDISLVGLPVVGRISAYRAGHGLNHKLVAKLLKHKECWEIRETPFESAGAPFFSEGLSPALA